MFLPMVIQFSVSVPSGHRHKMWLGFPPSPASSHNKLCHHEGGDVLHHCSYSDVNGCLPVSANNPLTSDDAGPPTADPPAGGQRDTQVQGSNCPRWTVTG